MPGVAVIAAAAMLAAGPVRRLEVGPDRIICGVTAPEKGTRLGLILWFHGGMRSQRKDKGLEAHRPLLDFVSSHDHVLASPSAYQGRDWLGPRAIPTVEALIDTLLALYPIDPDDIRLIGVSDGCLAVIRYGREGRRSVRNKVLVSSLPQLAVSERELKAGKGFSEGRWDFLQGGRDRLFPADEVLPFLVAWERLHGNAHLHFFPDGEHDFRYYAAHAPGLLRDLLGGPADGKPTKPKNSKLLQKTSKKT